MKNKIFFIFKILFFSLLLASCIAGGGDASKKLLIAASESDTTTGDVSTDTSGDTASTLVRPSNQIFIADYCACLLGKPDILNNCKSFCQSRNDKNPTLYVNVSLGPEIANNPDLKTLTGWCTNPLPGSDNPACQIEAYDGENFRYIDVSLSGGTSTRFTANLTSLDKNKVYILTLVENNSGSNARSESFQIIRKDYTETSFQGPLKITPIHQYSCIFRGVTSAPSGYPAGTNNNESAYKLYYFYPDANSPPALPPNVTPYTYCHDIVTYGEEDQKIFPRLELTPNAFYVWNENDYRFYASDENPSKLKINDLIQKQLLADYNIVQNINLFSEQKWWQYPNISTSSGSSGSGSSSGSSGATTPATPRLGFIMQSLRDANTGLAYCPTQTQYNSNEPLFKILKNFVGVDTEGIYLAVRDPESYKDQNGALIQAPDSYILIRESLLKRIWFYFENGRHYTPTASNAGDKTLLFYWPADTSYPYVKKPGQRIYTVKHLSELNSTSSTGPRPEYIPSDRRIGCVPARGN